MDEQQASELELEGGNSGRVVRSGDTVRRPAGPWTPNVHRLMTHLRDGGFREVPQVFGVDPKGREVVEYVEGDVGNYPAPSWVWNDDLLIQVARSMRAMHDKTADRSWPAEGWRREPVEPTGVVCHGDMAPYNTVCRAGKLVAFIDWDYAVPAPRGWDVGYAAYRWVSLTPPGHTDGLEQTAEEQQRRLRLFCDSYGLLTEAEVVSWAVARLEDLSALSRPRAEAGDAIFQATLEAGHVDLYEADAAWLRSTYLFDA